MAEDATPLEEAIVKAVDQALDLFVYAPLGLALSARDHLPDLVARGRKQVEQQTTLARMMGEYAVREADKEVRKRVTRPGPAPASSPSAPASAAPAAAAPPVADTSSVASVPTAAAATSSVPPPTSSHLAIPGYDTLSASQVVQRLAGLSAEELDAVGDYEAATRGRRTILTKVSQLQSGA